MYSPSRRMLIAVCGCLLWTQGASALELHVAPGGDDSWSGRLAEPSADLTDGPYATPGRALAEIKAVHESDCTIEPITVELQEGTYFLQQPLKVKPIHSGTAQNPVTFRSADGAQVVISGGYPVKDWQQEGELLVTTIDTAVNGSWYFKELYHQDERRTRARMPNRGEFFRAEGGFSDRPKGAMRYANGDLQAWESLDEVTLTLYNSWTAVVHRIRSIDGAARRVDFAADMWWEVGKWEYNQRYYVENLPQALDTAGEWYLDPQTYKLSYYPRVGETAETLRLIAPRLRRVLVIEGDYAGSSLVEYVNFEGITFAHADWHLGATAAANGQAHVVRDNAVIHCIGAANCSFTDCEVGPGGSHGVVLSYGCNNTTISRCDVHGLGGGGVYVGTTGEHSSCKTMSTAERIHHNTVDNCYVHDLGNVFHGAVGVWIGNADHITVSHNDICDVDYTGVSVGWCWGYNPSAATNNTIEFNHIHHLGQGELSDMGGVYCLGISPGTVVRNNRIHDVYAYSYGGWGLYTDQASTGILMENNVVYDVKSHGFHQHFGEDNIVRNNVFAYAGEGGVKRSKNEDHRSFTFQKNIVYQPSGIVLAGKYGDNNFEFDYNLYWSPAGAVDFDGSTFTAWQQRGHDQHSIVGDPLFADVDNRDFSLRAGSPATGLGFSSIDIEKAGLYGDAAWRERPLNDEHRGVSPYMKPASQTLFAIHDFSDGFEETAAGEPPAMGILHGIGGSEPRGIYVSDTRALNGSHSLCIADNVLAERTWEPFLTYEPRWSRPGDISVSFDIYLEGGATILHEWRDKLHGYPDNVGASVKLVADGDVKANGRTLGTAPADTWIHIALNARIDTTQDAVYDIEVTVDGETRTETGVPMRNAGWHVFSQAYFISSHNTAVNSYIDNVHLLYEPDEQYVAWGVPRTAADSHDEGARLMQRNGAWVLSVSAARYRRELLVYAANGRQVIAHPLAARSAHRVRIGGGTLAPGLYRLVVQGKSTLLQRSLAVVH